MTPFPSFPKDTSVLIIRSSVTQFLSFEINNFLVNNNILFIVRPTFIRIWKKGSVEQYSAAPYLATLVNCGLWVVYGLPLVHPHSTLVVTINGSGFAIELVYLTLFLIFSSRNKRVRVLLVMLAEFVFIGVLALLVLTLAHTTKLRSTIVGSICMLGCFLMYASPLSVMVGLFKPFFYICNYQFPLYKCYLTYN